MLLLLTGDIQIGKTRWLQGAARGLERAGVPVAGVLAPGVWRPRPEGGFEKLGIDNELLPGHERIPFARRRDLVEPGGLAGCGQSEAEGLGWAISDEAMARVNAHLASVCALSRPPTCPGLLVVDELGRLELVRGGGLTEAVSLARRGPTPALPHALVVVRDYLVPRATELLGPAWPDGVRVVGPTDAARDLLRGLYLHPGAGEPEVPDTP